MRPFPVDECGCDTGLDAESGENVLDAMCGACLVASIAITAMFLGAKALSRRMDRASRNRRWLRSIAV